MYKLIALDMDGTLLNEKKIVTERTKDALKKAREKGCKIVLASGRPLDGLIPYLDELNLTSDEDYVLSFNGAVVKNVGTKKTISSTALKGSDLHYLASIAKKLKINSHGFTNLGCIAEEHSKYTQVESDINKIPVNVIKYSDVKPDEDVIKFMFVGEPENLDNIITKLDKSIYEKYTVVRSAAYFLEFLNKEVNKGEGLKALTKHLGYDMSEVVAFGDAGNDLHMIKYAGLGVAMENGFDDVKEVADFVTKSNEEDGVAFAIEKFVLNN